MESGQTSHRITALQHLGYLRWRTTEKGAPCRLASPSTQQGEIRHEPGISAFLGSAAAGGTIQLPLHVNHAFRTVRLQGVREGDERVLPEEPMEVERGHIVGFNL
jgi:hypothetical protein